jgi:outer membrane protein TolC
LDPPAAILIRAVIDRHAIRMFVGDGTPLEAERWRNPIAKEPLVQRLQMLPLLLAGAVLFPSLAASPAIAQTSAPATPAVRAGTPAGPAEAPSPLFAPPAPGGLTADQVAQQAAATSRDAQADRESRLAADAGVNQAKAAFIPRLSGTARYTRLSAVEQASLGNLVGVPAGVPAGPIPAGTQLVAFPLTFPQIEDQYATQATLSLPVSDYLYRLPKLHQAAKGSARSAALLEQATRVRVATDGRIAYYNWARARMQADVAQRNLVQAQGHLKDVSAASAAGGASKADVLRVESQVAAAELAVARASSNVQIGEDRLRTLMHDTSGRAYAVGEDLADSAPTSDLQDATRKPLPALVEEAMTRRLEPRALLESAAATRAQASAQRSAALPRVDAVANAYYSRPNQRIFPQQDKFAGTWDAGVQLSWSPTDIFGIEAGHSATMARSRELEAERAALADGIEQEVTQARQSMLEAEVAIESASRGLAAAEESYRVRRALFQNGRATSVELTDAETERSRAQLDAIATRIDQRIASARLRHALGRDVASVTP